MPRLGYQHDMPMKNISCVAYQPSDMDEIVIFQL